MVKLVVSKYLLIHDSSPETWTETLKSMMRSRWVVVVDNVIRLKVKVSHMVFVHEVNSFKKLACELMALGFEQLGRRV